MAKDREIKILSAGAGSAYWVGADHVTIKVTGEETGGAYALVEVEVPPGAGPPPHIHRREDEAFSILEGEFEQGNSIVAQSNAGARHCPHGDGCWESAEA